MVEIAWILGGIAFFLGEILLVILALIIAAPIALIAYIYEVATTPSPEKKLDRASREGQQGITEITNKYRKQVKKILNNP